MYPKEDDVLFAEFSGMLPVPESHSGSVAATRTGEEIEEYFLPAHATEGYHLAVARREREVGDSHSKIGLGHRISFTSTGSTASVIELLSILRIPLSVGATGV